jgi:hypothetical protein
MSILFDDMQHGKTGQRTNVNLNNKSEITWTVFLHSDIFPCIHLFIFKFFRTFSVQLMKAGKIEKKPVNRGKKKLEKHIIFWQRNPHS